MFLKKLYHHSKFSFIVLILFLCSYTFLNIKWGATATPIYQYGMFSGVMHRADTQRIPILNANLNISHLPFAQRDELLVSLEQYALQRQKNTIVFATMKRLLTHIGFGNAMKEGFYTNKTTDEDFKKWYKSLLESHFEPSDIGVKAFSQQYVWKAGKLTPVHSPEKLVLLDQ